jgi:hypothetical protein
MNTRSRVKAVILAIGVAVVSLIPASAVRAGCMECGRDFPDCPAVAHGGSSCLWTTSDGGVTWSCEVTFGPCTADVETFGLNPL